MRRDLNGTVRLALAVVVILGLAGCSAKKNNMNAQSQESKDEKTREDVASATQKAKEESRVAAKSLDEAAHQAAHEAKVAAQGAKEGWNRKETGPVNVNSASKEQLETLPGLSAKQSEDVINGRPYSSKHDLVTRGIISEDEYSRIADRLTTQ
jgi:DNA uptake protein ComE-like DNA-binding protein